MICENNKINISDYFANKEKMDYITEKYIQFSKYLQIEDTNYMPFIYYYFRHKVGAVIYYIDKLDKSFNNSDEIINDLKKIINEEKLIVNKNPLQKTLFKGNLVLNYIMHFFAPKKTKNKTLFVTSNRFWNQHAKKDIEYGNLQEFYENKSYLMVNHSLYYQNIFNQFKYIISHKDMLFPEAYYDLKLIKETCKKVKQFKIHWTKIRTKKSLKQIFNYKNINYFPIIDKQIQFISNTSLYYIIGSQLAIKKLLKKNKFEKVFITNEENLFNKAIIQNKNLSTVISISHEYIYPGCIHSFKKVAPKKIRFLPDLKLVWNEYSKNILLTKCGYEGKNIEVIGNPKFAELKKIHTKKKESKNYKILFISENKIELLNFLKKLPYKEGIKVYYKPRSKEDYEKTKKYLNNTKVIVTPWKINLYSFINNVDLVVATVSTVILEAIMLNKPVVIFNPNIQLPDMPHLTKKIFFFVSNSKELMEIVDKLRYEPYLRQYLAKYQNFIKKYVCINISQKKIKRILKNV